MKKRNLLYMLLAAILVVVLAVMPASTHAEETGNTDPGESYTDEKEAKMTVSKHIHVEDDGTYTINLEAFAIGEASFTTVTVPADIILVLDVSGSMAENMTNESYEYTALDSTSYSYDSYGNNQYYYKHTDNEYYLVERQRTGSSGNRRYNLHYTVRSGYVTTTYYLHDDGISTSQNTAQVTSSTADIYTGVLYTRKTIPAVTKIDALKSAVSTFIDVVADKNKGITNQNEMSRIAIVKFAGNSRNGTNYGNYTSNIGNETYVDGWTYNYTQVVADLGVVTEGSNATNWKNTVNGFDPGGATHADFGMGYANAIIDAHKNDHNYTNPEAADYRSRVVVMFTDGLPTSSQNFEASVANAAISTSKTLKSNGVTVYSVAVHPQADPEQDPPSTNFNQYLHGVSSNYPDATAYSSLGTRGPGNYFKVASDAASLDAIFKDIASSSGGTSSTVSSEAVMKDIVSSAFTLPEGATEDDITISIVRWNTNTRKWGTGSDYEFTPAQWATYTEEKYGAEGKETVSATVKGDTVDVTGFNYAKHYKATNDEQDANNQYDQTEVNKNTAKIVVSFKILAKPSAVTGGSLATNGADSGIYINGDATEPIIRFPQPHVTFTPVTYVVDYVTSSRDANETKPNTIILDYKNVLKNVQMLDNPEDDVLIGIDLYDPETPFQYRIFQGKYGTISFGDNAGNVNEKRRVRYAPTTMNWDGYDRIFIKGESVDSTDEKQLNVWAMLAVIPANSVYYEDTFITTEKHPTYNGYEATIEYTGIDYSGFTEVGAEGSNTSQHAEGDMGWIDVLADDTTYSNGSAHTASTSGATATFPFTGTGVEIYSRTNGTTGTVLVTIRGARFDEEGKLKRDDNGNLVTGGIVRAKSIDTKAAGGDYYGVPVCSFMDLPYGTYVASIRVTTGGQKEGRMTYYIEGVRVYNPIQELEGDGVVTDVYGEKNLGAVFTSIRDQLDSLDPKPVLYIDEHTVTEEIQNDPAEIQAAAAEFAAAQDALEAWITQYITPLETILAQKQAALAEAIDDIVDPENPTAEETAKVNDARAAVQTAQDNLDAKNADPEKAELEAAVVEKRNAYNTLNDGMSISYTTTDVEEYKKEGPKSEVLLDKNQSIAISVTAGKTYYIGLKAYANSGTTVSINNTTNKSITHSTDLYYEATPANNGETITIKNTGDGILSITKLRTTGVENTVSGIKSIPEDQLFAAFRAVMEAPVTEYTGDVLTEEEAEAPAEEPAEEEPEDEVVEVTEDDIIIDNPEPEEEAEPETPSTNNNFVRLLRSFFGFFRP